MTSPQFLLRLEGLAVAAAAVLAYRSLGASWTEFWLLCLAPDLAMLGFAFGARVGAVGYNLVHTYAAVALLGLVGYECRWAGVTAVCLIWTTHIAADRLLGFGLKYPSAFKDTHLQRV